MCGLSNGYVFFFLNKVAGSFMMLVLFWDNFKNKDLRKGKAKVKLFDVTEDKHNPFFNGNASCVVFGYVFFLLRLLEFLRCLFYSVIILKIKALGRPRQKSNFWI